MGGYYPIAIDLAARPCVVIGGGRVAEQKVRGLLAAGARVLVISDAPTAGLAALEAQGCITIAPRGYRPGDLRGAFLAIAAGDHGEHPAIWAEAAEEHVLLNAVDDARHCHFIAPAIHRQGGLAIAVSTGGRSPALAVRIRDRIAALVGPEYGVFLDLLGAMRPEVAAREPDPLRRSALWYRLVDSDALGRLRRGDAAGAIGRLAALLSAGADE